MNPEANQLHLCSHSISEVHHLFFFHLFSLMRLLIPLALPSPCLLTLQPFFPPSTLSHSFCLFLFPSLCSLGILCSFMAASVMVQMSMKKALLPFSLSASKSRSLIILFLGLLIVTPLLRTVPSKYISDGLC